MTVTWKACKSYTAMHSLKEKKKHSGFSFGCDGKINKCLWIQVGLHLWFSLTSLHSSVDQAMLYESSWVESLLKRIKQYGALWVYYTTKCCIHDLYSCRKFHFHGYFWRPAKYSILISFWFFYQNHGLSHLEMGSGPHVACWLPFKVAWYEISLTSCQDND